jgi:hypothetical protein
MAFSRDNLTPYGNNGKRGSVPSIWFYYNEDGDTVTTSGYMTNCYELTAKDIIWEQSANGQTLTFYYVSSVSNGAATLVAGTVT